MSASASYFCNLGDCRSAALTSVSRFRDSTKITLRGGGGRRRRDECVDEARAEREGRKRSSSERSRRMGGRERGGEGQVDSEGRNRGFQSKLSTSAHELPFPSCHPRRPISRPRRPLARFYSSLPRSLIVYIYTYGTLVTRSLRLPVTRLVQTWSERSHGGAADRSSLSR